MYEFRPIPNVCKCARIRAVASGTIVAGCARRIRGWQVLPDAPEQRTGLPIGPCLSPMHALKWPFYAPVGEEKARTKTQTCSSRPTDFDTLENVRRDLLWHQGSSWCPQVRERACDISLSLTEQFSGGSTRLICTSGFRSGTPDILNVY